MAAPTVLTAAEAVAAVPEAIFDPAIVLDVQRKLIAKGYVDVGGVDGDPGQMTQDTILSFRARNDLPLVPVIDRDFIRALDVALPKSIPIEQANATVAHVADRVAVVKTNWWQRVWAKILAFPSVALAITTAIIDNLNDASGKLSAVKAFLSDVPVWIWPALVAVVALVLSRNANKIETGMVQGYQQGTVKNDPESQVIDPPSLGTVEAKVNGNSAVS